MQKEEEAKKTFENDNLRQKESLAARLADRKRRRTTKPSELSGVAS